MVEVDTSLIGRESPRLLFWTRLRHSGLSNDSASPVVNGTVNKDDYRGSNYTSGRSLNQTFVLETYDISLVCR